MKTILKFENGEELVFDEITKQEIIRLIEYKGNVEIITYKND